MIEGAQPLDADLYFEPKPDRQEATSINASQTTIKKSAVYISDKLRLIFYLDCFIGIRRLYIPQAVAPEMLAIVYNKKYSSFSRCHKIIFCS